MRREPETGTLGWGRASWVVILGARIQFLRKLPSAGHLRWNSIYVYRDIFLQICIIRNQRIISPHLYDHIATPTPTRGGPRRRLLPPRPPPRLRPCMAIVESPRVRLPPTPWQTRNGVHGAGSTSGSGQAKRLVSSLTITSKSTQRSMSLSNPPT